MLIFIDASCYSLTPADINIQCAADADIHWCQNVKRAEAAVLDILKEQEKQDADMKEIIFKYFDWIIHRILLLVSHSIFSIVIVAKFLLSLLLL